jgi:hypothetical protein
VGCSVDFTLALASSGTYQTYCAQLLGFWNGGICFLGEVLVRLEYLSAGHGGGVVMYWRLEFDNGSRNSVERAEGEVKLYRRSRCRRWRVEAVWSCVTARQ